MCNSLQIVVGRWWEGLREAQKVLRKVNTRAAMFTGVASDFRVSQPVSRRATALDGRSIDFGTEGVYGGPYFTLRALLHASEAVVNSSSLALVCAQIARGGSSHTVTGIDSAWHLPS